MIVAKEADFSKGFWLEILFRAFLAVIFLKLEYAEPFERKIHPEELWLYKNPQKEDYVPTNVLWPLVFFPPIAIIVITFQITKDKFDLRQGILCSTLALALSGILVDILKLIVGRPRPDFFWRCFPNGDTNLELNCNGDHRVIMEGRKSFPSGHCSFAFASCGFIAFYLAGKLRTFTLSGKGYSWNLCAFLIPLVIALIVALSRTCDYHHHWQDVLIGSLIGFGISYLCYRHYYPSLDSQFCHRPYLISVN
ncbi:phospholipid phosphatase 5 [Leptopilina boulardi]|uniref:phospholipid phosphatase 5 n=1 Tax=Leptopilina boulardi TaxID=63433 RepID=UPI0021F5CADC|nr:phospholipid phosphatase 5 [Leptopilina boulardi]